MIGAVTQNEILDYIRVHPGCSTKEIRTALAENPHQFNTDRKLGQLRRWGYIESETVRPPKGNRYLVWRCIE